MSAEFLHITIDARDLVTREVYGGITAAAELIRMSRVIRGFPNIGGEVLGIYAGQEEAEVFISPRPDFDMERLKADLKETKGTVRILWTEGENVDFFEL